VLRSLVINADDLGVTVGVNNGTFGAHDRGVLTIASRAQRSAVQPWPQPRPVLVQSGGARQ
jgi:hypothetical protein